MHILLLLLLLLELELELELELDCSNDALSYRIENINCKIGSEIWSTTIISSAC